MKSFKQYITEVFDKPYQWKWERKLEHKAIAKAKTKDGSTLAIMFNKYRGDIWDVDFTINGLFSLTNNQDEFKVLATVLDTIKSFMEETPEMKELHIESRKRLDAKEKSDRSKLYERLVKRFIPKGWSFKKKEDKTQYESITTIILKKD